MNTLKTIVKQILLLPLMLLGCIASLYGMVLVAIKPSFGNVWLERQAARNRDLVQEVRRSVGGKSFVLKFYTPNAICRFRADTFADKEPETLDWIDEFGGNGALFDIGANIGLYSIYYAVTKNANVYAFEPSVFNLALLAKNINANNVEHQIKIISNPLSAKNHFADFTLSTTEEGGALSAFGVDYGYDGKKIAKSLSYQTLGFSLDSLMQSGHISEYPRMIKIDVDGIESLILAGATNLLKHPTVETVLIEVTDQQAVDVASLLTTCGFKRHTKYDLKYHSENQIWIRA